MSGNLKIKIILSTKISSWKAFFTTNFHQCYIYMYVYIYMNFHQCYIYMYVYIYIYREREREMNQYKKYM